MDTPFPSPQDSLFMQRLQEELAERIRTTACGPFLAAVCNARGELIAKAANSVTEEKCSHCHAEMNAIRAAQQQLGTYDLAPYDLTLYSTAEPCMMCLGGILWSGIRRVCYGVPTAAVEAITGFDEGFKPDWEEEFRKRGIAVCGGVASETGEAALRSYVEAGKTVYKPSR